MAVLRQLRSDQGNPGRLGGQRTAPAAAQTTRTVQDPMAAGRFLRGRDRRAPARGHPTSQDCRNLVAGDPDCPHPRCQQCPHRRLQPNNQTDQAGRLRVQYHKSTTSAVSSATSRSPDRKDQQHERVTPPLKFEEPHHLGGAMGRVATDATAFAHRQSPLLLNCIARSQDPADMPPIADWARRTREDMSRFGSGTYVNFTGEGGAERVAYPPQTSRDSRTSSASTTPTTPSGSTRTSHQAPGAEAMIGRT